MRRAAPTVLLGVALVAGQSATMASAEPRMRVVYHAPLLSIDASEVTVAEILREVGRAVGFSVVEAGSSDARLSFSIHDASLPVVLRQVLRSENHVLSYREGSQTIDTVMVLGARAGRAPAPFNQPDQTFSRSEGPDQGRTSQSVEIAPTPATPVSGALTREVVNATDLLLRHAGSAMPAFQPISPSGGTPGTSSSMVTGDAKAADPGTTLATTTRLAQQNLAKLVQALSAATASMSSSQRR